MSVKYLEHSEINRAKWNTCILNSVNGTVYAFCWYLDIVCPGWDALVEGDYDTVMPLTAGEKYKIPYLYQPYFTQQLGVFSTKKPDSDKVEKFLNAIPEKYRFIEINLNILNKLDSDYFKKKVNVTYQLDLIEPYNKLYDDYSTNTKRNLKKAENNKISVIEGLTPGDLIDLFKKNTALNINKLKDSHYNTLKHLMLFSQRNRIGKIYGAYTSNNSLCAGAFFITSHNKSIYLFPAAGEDGKKQGAAFAIINHYIKKNSENNLTLDFEGSNIPGLARFYSSFGATACEYLSIKKNNLPWYLKIFKK